MNLAASVAEALLRKPVEELPPTRFGGAGVYCLYYSGGFAQYKKISERNSDGRWEQPIYVGKAVPKGARKGSLSLESGSSSILFRRLAEHTKTLQETENLSVEHFRCRYLVADEIWIPLGESLLISRYKPLWNLVVEGFGNHDPGSGRHMGRRSLWDELHPGRGWAARLQPCLLSASEILDRVRQYLA